MGSSYWCGAAGAQLFKVTQLDIGFRTKQVYSWQIDSGREFESPQSRNNYYRELKQRIALVNGVESASLSDTVPFGYKRHWPLDAKGVSYQEGEHRGGYVRFIDDQCLQTVNTPLLRGRYFNHSDRIGSEPVVIISQSLAKNAWKGEDPLGKIALVNNGAEYKVIGIVADVAHGLDGNTPPDFYLSFEQWERSHWSSPNLVFRTTASSRSPLGQVRAAIQEYDATLPTNEFTHLTDMVTVHGLRTYVFRPNSCISVSVYVKKRISRKRDLKSSQLGPQYTLLGDSVRVQGVSGYQVNLE